MEFQQTYLDTFNLDVFRKLKWCEITWKSPAHLWYLYIIYISMPTFRLIGGWTKAYLGGKNLDDDVMKPVPMMGRSNVPGPEGQLDFQYHRYFQPLHWGPKTHSQLTQSYLYGISPCQLQVMFFDPPWTLDTSTCIYHKHPQTSKIIFDLAMCTLT